MSVAATYTFGISIKETIEVGVPDAGTPTINRTGYNETGKLTGSTTPPATKCASFLLTLTAGAATINLASLVGANGATVDGTGLRVQLLRIKNLGANNMTFSEGAANGIALVGLPMVVPPGGITQRLFNDAAPDIAAADRTIDVAGTGAQTAEVTVVMG
jgi:hypothetical protein